MKKILVVFGTRPEAIKMCPLVIELKKRNIFDVKVCVTGQHKEMLNQVLHVFHVEPNYDLSIMKDNQSLFDISINVLHEIKKVLVNEKPNLVLVHGDTSTSFITSLACYYLQIPVGHVEAGLRTNNIYSPYPEEYNREAISLLSKFNFAPTEWAANNLIKEGKNKDNIFVTGNTVIDAMKYTISNNFYHKELEWIKNDKFILITAHRRENLGKPLHQMFKAIRRVLDEYDDIKAIYPIHLNPVVRKIAEEEFKGCNKIHIIEPVDVVAMHNFESRCYLCLTDSGGIQEECTSLGKPVLVMRNTTERPEGIQSGVLKLVGNEEANIYYSFKSLLDDDEEYRKMSNASGLYGDGNASRIIANILEERLNDF